jgi:hypothetical protein
MKSLGGGKHGKFSTVLTFETQDEVVFTPTTRHKEVA